MSSIQRRLALLLGALAVFMAFAAAPALAVDDFPHETSSSKWVGIEAFDWNGGKGFQGCGDPAGDCAFEDTASVDGYGSVFGFVSRIGPNNCTVKGDMVTTTGEIDITSGTGNCEAWPSPTNAQVCQHKTTGEYWVRMPINSGSNASVGFGHLVVNPSGVATNVPTHFVRGIALGAPEYGTTASFSYTNSYGYIGLFYQANFNEMWESSEILIGPSQSSAACGWAELS